MENGKRVPMKRGAMWRHILLATLVVLVVACAQTCFGYEVGDPEYRAFFVDAWHAGALNQGQVDTLLGVPGNGSSIGQIREANCNTVVLQVRRNADALYPSQMNEPYMSGITPSDFNGLQAVINAAHDTTGGKQRIDVHAWIVTFRTGGGTVYSRHDDPPTGSLTELDNYWICRDSGGAEVGDRAFDPGHPKAEEYIVNVAMDIVTNFDVDGIHFDYVRFTSPDQGYNPTSVARYNVRYGLTGQPAALNEQFQQWRRDQITALLRQVYARVQAVKPWVKQSTSLFTGSPGPGASTRQGFEGVRAFYEVYSDWDSWLEEGIIDIALPMTYFDYNELSTDYTKWLNYEKNRHHNRHMVIAPGLYLNSLENSVMELQMTRDPSPEGNHAHGFCGFSHYTPFSGGSWAAFKPAFIAGLTSDGPVSLPDMPWKSAPTTGHISGTVTYELDGRWVDGALVTITGPDSRTQYCDGTGFYAFIDLTPGTYTITVSKPGYVNVVRDVTVEIGSVTGNMYVNDFQLVVQPPPPAISEVTVADLRAQSAGITWTTDQAATSQVEYGTTTDYGTSTALDSDHVTSHSVNLSGLSPDTTYHYRVISTNANGTAYSSDATFVTTELLEITNIAATDISGTTATITWTTNQAGSSKVEYGTTSEYGSSTATDTAEVLSHSMTLTGLTPGAPYHYRVVSGNDNGTASSGNNTFATVGFPVISNVQVINVTSNAAVVTWATELASTSQVDYGLTTAYGATTDLDVTTVVAHSVALIGLAPNTTYNYRVRSVGTAGEAISENRTFSTDGPPVISNIQAINVTTAGATITWSTDKPSSTAVSYGLTSSYDGDVVDSEPVTEHSIRITGLTRDTAYHFQCSSTNGYGTCVSTDLTLTTSDGVADIIVDNTDPGWQNTSPNGNLWTEGNLESVSKIGQNYLYYKGDGRTYQSSITRKCTWTPHIEVGGLYDVYAYYQTGPDRSSSAPFRVYHFGSSIKSVQNQNRNSSYTGWYLLGANLPFEAGTAGYVELTTMTSDRTRLVSADAIKWVYKGPADLDPPGITIGEPSSSLTTRGPVTFTVQYEGADSVTLTSRNVTLSRTGTASATMKVSGTGTASRTVTLSYIKGTGTLSISIPAGTARDAAGNLAPATGPSTPVVVDNQAPTISVSKPSPAATASGPVDYTVTYGGADSITLSPANITLTRTSSATGTVSVLGEGNQTRTVRISEITGSGTLRISIASGTASDLAGNKAAGSGSSATVSVDNTPPTISIGKPSVYSTSRGPISYTVYYGGAGSISLSPEDITLVKTGDVEGTIAVSGTGTTRRTVTVSSVSGSGTLAISIAAGTATDAAGNSAPAIGPSLVTKVDNSPPVMNEIITPRFAASTSSIKASWSASDPESGIKRYEYAVGTTPLGTQIRRWTSAGSSLSMLISRMSLAVGSTYYVSVRAVNVMNLMSEPISSEGVLVAQPVAGIRSAKLVVDGTNIALPTKVVTVATPGVFYIEDGDRRSGIRVEYENSLMPGQSVKVTGTIGVAENGERAILDAELPFPPASSTPIKPIVIALGAVGGATEGLTPGPTGGSGANNTGLLVQISGKVTAVVSDGFYLDEDPNAGLVGESGNPGVKVWTGSGDSVLMDSSVTVIGAVSLLKSGDILCPQIVAQRVLP